MKSLTVSELENRLCAGDHLQLVDVRSAGEYATGHIPGASNIPMDQAESRLADLTPGANVVLLCQSGQRAGMTCELLQGQHPDLLVLEGGTAAWVAAGKPVVRTASTRWALERQVRLTAGLLAFTGSLLALLVHPAWVYLPLFIGAGLTFAGITNLCGMAILLARMPWNRPVANACAAPKRPAPGH